MSDPAAQLGDFPRAFLAKEQLRHTAFALSTPGQQPGRAVEQGDVLADGIDPNQPSALVLRHATIEKPRNNGTLRKNLSIISRAVGNEKRIIVVVGSLHDHDIKLRSELAAPDGAT